MGFDGLIPNLPFQSIGAGMRTSFGTLLPPGGRVAAYVRSTPLPIADGDDPEISSLWVSTLDQGLARCRAGRGDTVVVLPGHSEDVTATACRLASLVNGCRIIGMGEGSNMPVFRWTATGSQWVMDNNDVTISGLRLRMEGANGIVKAIAISGTDCCIRDCDIELASGAALKATIGIEMAAGAHRTIIVNNFFRGTATHNVTDGVLVAGVANDCQVAFNTMVASATAINGLIRVAAVAALGLRIHHNIVYNTHTASSAGIAFGAAASNGFCVGNHVFVLNDGVAAAQGITFGAGCLVKASQNYCSDEPQKSGVLAPAAVAS